MGHDGHDHPHDEHGSHAHPSTSAKAASPADEHRHAAPAQVATFLITCSDSRTAATDESGHVLREALEHAGHPLAGQVLIANEEPALRMALDQALAAGARAVVISGGTGISSRDRTVEVVSSLFEKRLDGFGELFRSLSFAEIGSAALLSRAVAGTWRGAVLFALPGSPHAAQLAMERLILPELGHLVRELTR